MKVGKLKIANSNPLLTAFSDGDPITRGGEKLFKKRVPGTKNQPHTTIKGGGHFLQEDCAEEFAGVIVDFINRKQSKSAL